MQSFSKKVFNILSKEKTNMLTQLYRKYIPEEARKKIYSLFLKDFLHFYRRAKATTKAKIRRCFFFMFPKTEQNQMYQFMGKYGLTPHPWTFTLEYTKQAECFVEKSIGLTYVVHKGKKLFFPRNFSKKQVQDTYRSLIIEQDIRSPHRYLEDDYSQLQGKIVFDLGGAEGIFSLDSIDYAKHIFLFECEDVWIEALNATFSQWTDKLTIVPKYVSDKISAIETTIDSYIPLIDDAELFLKMDIEGAEPSALKGAEEMLRTRNVQLSVCAYHTPWDASDIQTYLTSLGYKTSFTDGYMYINYSFNKALIRASKK